MQGRMRSVEIVVMEEEGEEDGAVVAGLIRASIGPFAGNGLDKAFGLAIGLWAVRFGEEMLEAEFLAGSGKEFGAVARALVGEDALDGDAMGLVEGDGLVESGQDAGSFFIREETGKGQTGMVIDGDMEGLDPGAWIAVGAIAGGADAGLMEAAEFFNIQMKEFAGRGALITDDRRFGRFEGTEAIEAMTAEDSGKGSF